MKIAIQFLALAILLVSTSCKSIDTEFLSKMQSDMASMEAVGETLNGFGSQLADLKNGVDALPEAVKTNADSGYGAIVEQLGGLITKQTAMSGMFGDLMGKFKSLVADYTAGKIKTDAAKTMLGELTSGFGSINTDMKSANDTYTNLLSGFNAMKAAAAEATDAAAKK